MWLWRESRSRAVWSSSSPWLQFRMISNPTLPCGNHCKRKQQDTVWAGGPGGLKVEWRCHYSDICDVMDWFKQLHLCERRWYSFSQLGHRVKYFLTYLTVSCWQAGLSGLCLESSMNQFNEWQTRTGKIPLETTAWWDIWCSFQSTIISRWFVIIYMAKLTSIIMK